MAIDNTHLKYLHGHDKKVWEEYKKALDAQKRLDNMFGNWSVPDLAEGEEYEVPMKGHGKKK